MSGQEVTTSGIEEGLNSYYRFESSGKTEQYSLRLDGTDDYVEVDDDGYPSKVTNFSQATYCAWIKPEALSSTGGADQRLIEKRDHTFSISLTTSGNISTTYWYQVDPSIENDGHTADKSLGYYDSGANEWVSDNLNKWYHFCTSFGPGDKSRIYINGQLDSEVTLPEKNGRNVGNFSHSTKTQFGRYRYDADHFYNGKIDEVKLYNKSLTGDQIREVKKGLPVESDNLMFYQRFNEGPENCGLSSTQKCLKGDSLYNWPATGYNINNTVGTQSGWSTDSPLNNLSLRDSSDNEFQMHTQGMENGEMSGNFLENWEENNSEGWQLGCGGQPENKMVEDTFISDYAYLLNSTGGDGLACTRLTDYTYSAVEGETIQYACKGYGCKLIVWNGSTDISSGPGTDYHEYSDEWKIYTTRVEKTQSDANIYMYNDDQVGHWAIYDMITEGPIQNRTPRGKGLRLDGYDDYIEIDRNITGVENFTVTGWVNYENLSRSTGNLGSSLIRANRDDYEWAIYAGNNNELKGYLYPEQGSNDSTILTTNINENQWYHAAIKREGKTFSLYLDGEKQASSTRDDVSGRIRSEQAIIGRPSTDSEKWLQGSVDDIRIYTRALSDKEIQKIYSGEPVSGELAGKWNFEDTDGKKAFDSASTGHKGILGGKALGGENSHLTSRTTLKGPEFTVTGWIEGDNSENMLKNPGFEEDPYDETNPENWNYPDENGWNVTDDRLAPNTEGSKSFGNPWNEGPGTWPNAYIYQNVSVEDNSAFKASAWINLPSYSDANWEGLKATPYVYEDDVRLHFYYYSENGTLLGENKTRWMGEAYNLNEEYVEKYGDWFHITPSYKPPKGTRTIRYQIDGGDGNNGYNGPSGGNAGLWMDDLSMKTYTAISENNRYGLTLHERKILAHVNGRFLESPELDKNWKLITLTFDGNTAKLYSGTQLIEEDYNISSSKKARGPTTLGRNYANKLDEVRIYNRSLNQNEIEKLAFQ
ncbi:LamG domain-containing protein [Candidatus Nanohalovita haloferacivicina]|uniref:LamG domain-containing protein n=1 Tax=Candidatus Nanohalovita haloferacivicina TaxID=2978046 RepID=UPI00325FB661